MKILFQILYAAILPVINLLGNFLPLAFYTYDNKSKVVLKTLLFSSRLVYTAWNCGCIYMIFDILCSMPNSTGALMRIMEILLVGFFIWLLYKYNEIIYDQMKDLKRTIKKGNKKQNKRNKKKYK